MDKKKQFDSIAMQPLSESSQVPPGPEKQFAESKPFRESDLRQVRLNELMESCQQEILRQIIGPFGLTPAMFDDKGGGNVTTQHNADQGIFAKESEKFDRDKDYDYSSAKSKKKRESVKNGSMNSQEFTDAYTGKSEPTKRINQNGKLVMNAELDHLVPLKEIHHQGGWMKGKSGRDELSSTPENLHYTTFETNRGEGGKHAKSPDEYLSSDNGFDESRIKPMVDQARKAIEAEMPTTKDRIKYHGKEIAKEGVKDAGKNALRQAFGILLHEFVNGSFVEIKIVLRERNQENLIDRVVESLKRVMQRVVAKLKDALDAAISGGVQGFVSNFLTFLINNFITTAKKVVTLIRESMKSLWEAIKLMVNPPQGMPAMEVARQVTKIISAAVTTALGLLLEESVKGFIMASPLAPLAGILAPALTAIITGIAGALLIYGIDRAFDWLSATGTEMLQAMENTLQATGENIERMAQWLDLQFQNSHHYAAINLGYSLIETTLDEAGESQHLTMHVQRKSIDGNAIFLEDLHITMTRQADDEQRITGLLNEYIERNEKK